VASTRPDHHGVQYPHGTDSGPTTTQPGRPWIRSETTHQPATGIGLDSVPPSGV